jgi:hypothetical protein
MTNCAACGCSPGKRSDNHRSVADSASAGERGVAAENGRSEVAPRPRSLGRALRKQRSRWLHLTRAQRICRVLFCGVAPVMLSVFPFVFGSAREDQIGGCPDNAAPTAESVPAMLADSGAVEKLDLTDKLSIAVTIYAGDQNYGGQVGMRRQMGRLIRGLYQVAQCFPAVKAIRADPLARRRTAR